MFYTDFQNNSGGSFYINDDVRAIVIVEALNAKEAEWKFKQITEDYMSYCECCGERWSYDCGLDGTEVPMIYDTPIEEYEASYYREDCIIYYNDGSKRIYNFKTKEYTEL